MNEWMNDRMNEWKFNDHSDFDLKKGSQHCEIWCDIFLQFRQVVFPRAWTGDFRWEANALPLVHTHTYIKCTVHFKLQLIH